MDSPQVFFPLCHFRQTIIEQEFQKLVFVEKLYHRCQFLEFLESILEACPQPEIKINKHVYCMTYFSYHKIKIRKCELWCNGKKVYDCVPRWCWVLDVDTESSFAGSKRIALTRIHSDGNLICTEPPFTR